MKYIRWPSRRVIPAVVSVAIFAFGCTAGESTNSTRPIQNIAPASPSVDVAELKIPSSLSSEHKEIHEMLAKVISLGGKTGDAAKAVEDKLSEHFKNEEQYAMPQLELLRQLADGKDIRSSKAIELSDRLKSEMPKMLEEHKAVVQALEALSAAANAEKKPLGAEFAEKLKAHALTEEEILYPASILVGQTLKARQRS